MVADNTISTATKNYVSIYTTDFDNIICNKTMTSFYKLKSSFALTNSGMTAQQNTNTVNLNKNTMQGLMRCKLIRKNTDYTIRKFSRCKTCLKKRTITFFGNVAKIFCRFKIVGKNAAWNFVGKKISI